MAEPLVVVEDLHKTFVHMGRELHVLRGIDLTIEQGDVMAIVGPSGAGKSTFLHCIGTLDLPTRGRIRLGNDELTGLSSSKLAAIRNRTIGFVFQFHHLLPEFNALENVMMPGLIQGKSRAEMDGPAHALLAEVGLAERVTHRPGELSGGEQQRVALARALVLSPKLILADEPTGNLDSATSEAMHVLFFEINRRHGTTIVVVTHNPAFAKAMPRVVTMRDGKVDTDERRVVNGPATKPAAAGAPEVVHPAPGLDDPELQKRAMVLGPALFELWVAPWDQKRLVVRRHAPDILDPFLRRIPLLVGLEAVKRNSDTADASQVEDSLRVIADAHELLLDRCARAVADAGSDPDEVSRAIDGVFADPALRQPADATVPAGILAVLSQLGSADP